MSADNGTMPVVNDLTDLLKLLGPGEFVPTITENEVPWSPEANESEEPATGDDANEPNADKGEARPRSKTSADSEPQSKEPNAGFPAECLPPVVADMVNATTSTLRVPACLASICALGVVSASIGKGLIMNTLPSQQTTGNLYLLAGAESGTGKSVAFNHLARPFLDKARQLMEDWKENDLPNLSAEKRALEAQIKGLESQVKNEGDEKGLLRCQMASLILSLNSVERKLNGPIYCVEDCTVEKLALTLQGNNECVASFSADAGSIVNNVLGRYNKTQRTDEDVYLKAFSGDPIQVARVGRTVISLDRPIMTCLWFTQPEKIKTLVGNESLREGGLLPRFLMCDTGAEPQPIFEDAPEIPTAIADEYRIRILNLIEKYRQAESPFQIEVSPEAKRVLFDYFNSVVQRRKADLHDVTSFAARWGENAWRVAIVLHAGLHGPAADGQPLSPETARNAVRIVEWFADQQLEILGSIRGRKSQSKRDAVMGLLAKKPSGITSREVQRRRVVKTSAEAHQLLEEMVADGLLVVEELATQGGGPVSRNYKVKLRPI